MDNIPALKEQIKRHEGKHVKDQKHVVYLDSMKNPTIGYGHLVTAAEKYPDGITEQQASELFDKDFTSAVNQAKTKLPVPWDSLHPKAQGVLVNMVFNMGVAGVGKFKKMCAALSNAAGPDYALAAAEMVDSAWYKQVGNRSKELVEIMKSCAK